MFVNQSISTYTTSLFQSQTSIDVTNQPAASPSPASSFIPGVNTDMTGVYTDPRIALVESATLSTKTQKILDKIQSLVTNELKTIGTKFREMAGADLELEPDAALSDDTKLFDLSDRQLRAMSKETKDVGWLEAKFSIVSSIATADAAKLSGVRAFAIGEQYVGMTKEELIDARINDLVDLQMNAVKQSMEMARSDEFKRYASNVESPTPLDDAMSEADMAAMRADLLAKRRDEFQRGELNIQVEIYSSMHAANYEKVYATLDTNGASLTINEENATAFDEAWTMTDRDKKTYSRMFEGITVVDGKPELDPKNANLQNEFGMEFLENYGQIGLEYLRDARA